MEDIGTTSNHTPNTRSQFTPMILLLAFVILFSSTYLGLYERWIKWDENLSHGLLINGVFIYLLFQSLPWFVTHQAKTTQYGLYACLALGSLAWFVFRLTNIYLFEQLLLIALLPLLLAASYGIKTVITYRLLLLLPIFTIPVWEQLTNTLVNLSGFIVGHLVPLANIPASIQGNSIFIPSGHIVIADGCSGLRYLEIALALGFIISLLNNYNEKRLLPTLLIAAALGLVANWLRIFLLVIIGYQSEMQSSLMNDHEYFGWALFGLLCLPAIYFAPSKKRTLATPVKSTLKPRIILPLILVAIGPALSLFVATTPDAAPLPARMPTERSIIFEGKLPAPVVAPERAYKEQGQFMTPLGVIYAEIDQYQRVSAQDKLVPYINRLYNHEEWLSNESSIDLATHKATLSQLRKKNTDKIIMQLQWYEIGSYKTTSHIIAKLLQVPAMLQNINNFTIVTIQTYCNGDNCEQAKSTLLTHHAIIFANPQQIK